MQDVPIVRTKRIKSVTGCVLCVSVCGAVAAPHTLAMCVAGGVRRCRATRTRGVGRARFIAAKSVPVTRTAASAPRQHHVCAYVFVCALLALWHRVLRAAAPDSTAQRLAGLLRLLWLVGHLPHAVRGRSC